MYLAISQQPGYQGFFEYGVYFFKTLYFFNVSINVKYLRIPII